MAASKNWISCILDLEKQITEVETNDTRFLALHFLADYVVQYVEWWTTQFDEQLKVKPEEAAAVGRLLAAVLDMVLKLCNAEANPSKIEGESMMPSQGEFLECVNHLRTYTQMMNRLIRRLLPCPCHDKKLFILQRLQHKVEVDCSLLHEIIENGFEGHKSQPVLHRVNHACSFDNVHSTMASLQWERYLYKEHSLVALNLGKNVQLFDVLVKRENEGKHPVLTKTGTLLGIQSSSGTNWEKIAAKIEAFLKGSLKKRDEAGIVERHMDGDYQCSINQASNVIKLLKLLNMGGGRSEGLFCEARVQTERIDSGLMEALFCCKPPLWVPKKEGIALERPVPSNNGLTEFWVVVEVKYCTKLTIELELPEELSRVPVTIGGGITVSRTRAGMVVAKGSKVPIGFKAVRLLYDKDGNLQQIVSGSDEIRPRFRYHGYHPFDPDNFPSYHMGGLFVDEAQEPLECLEFE